MRQGFTYVQIESLACLPFETWAATWDLSENAHDNTSKWREGQAPHRKADAMNATLS